MRIFVGCCGWGYFNPKLYFGDSWKKDFSSTLQAYASIYDLVEINSTFYKLPKEKTASRWFEEAKKINNNFIFTLKVNKVVSHEDMFRTRSSKDAFLRSLSIARLLKSEILLIQTPSSFKPTINNIKNIESFLGKINKILDNEKIVFEFRGDFLKKEKSILEICKNFKVEHCVDLFRNKPLFCNGILYFRIHGFGKKIMYNYNFSDKELNELKNRIKEVSKEFNPKEIFVLFNNYNMYQNALDFIKILEH